MNILIIGGNGTIGKKVTDFLKDKHTVVVASRSNADLIVDISDPESIENMYQKVKSVDAVISVAGEAKWAAFNDLTEEDFYIGIRSKLMGQVNLVKIGLNYISRNGSFTLTTGILADEPVNLTTSAAMVNGGIHSFVKAAALELENNIRINAVSASLVEDAFEKYQDYFPGYNVIPMQKVVNAYLRSVTTRENGKIFRVYN